jgi:hypothetical protein
MGTSVAQEYYKVQDYWKEADADKNWRLAIWVVDFHDVDIVDKFLKIETSPIGKFDDIFFHFESEYKGDDIAFEKALYTEYLSWFDKPHEKDIDILQALRNDGFFLSDYQPDRDLDPTAQNLWKEMLRLKSCLKGLENSRFCLCFPPHRDGEKNKTAWFKIILDEKVPEGIRLVVVDYAERRKVKLLPSGKVYIIRPELKMEEAINNEIERGAYETNTVGIEGRYTKQIKKVLDCSQKQHSLQLEKETGKLMEISREMQAIPTTVGTCMIISLAWFYNKDNEKCEKYADMSIAEAEEHWNEDMDLYQSWKGAMMLKAAMLMYRKKRREAIEMYNRMAEEAAKKQDAYFIMEAYRMTGHLYYELSELDKAFEYTLLAIAGGSYLEKEVRRQSTFVQAANLALYLCEQTRSMSDVEIVETQLKDLLGDDWKSLVKTENMNKSKKRRKASFFS